MAPPQTTTRSFAQLCGCALCIGYAVYRFDRKDIVS